MTLSTRCCWLMITTTRAPLGRVTDITLQGYNQESGDCQEKQENHLINWYFRLKINTHFNYHHVVVLWYYNKQNKLKYLCVKERKLKYALLSKLYQLLLSLPLQSSEKCLQDFKSVKYSDTFKLYICLYKDYISVTICSGCYCCWGNILYRIKIILCIN